MTKDKEKQEKLEKEKREKFLKWQKLWEATQKKIVDIEKECNKHLDEMKDQLKLLKMIADKIKKGELERSKEFSKNQSDLEKAEARFRKGKKLLEQSRITAQGLAKKLEDEKDEKKAKEFEEQLKKLKSVEQQVEKEVKQAEDDAKNLHSKIEANRKKGVSYSKELREIGKKCGKDYADSKKSLLTACKKYPIVIKELEGHAKSLKSNGLDKENPEMAMHLKQQIDDGKKGPIEGLDKQLDTLDKALADGLYDITPSITKTL